jgi:TATA-box binding protein (TBP) (component of TFIID and TFIIIB)
MSSDFEKYKLSEQSLNILSKFEVPEEKRYTNNRTILPSSKNSVFNIEYELYNENLRINPVNGNDEGRIDLYKLCGHLGICSFPKQKFSAATLRTTTNPTIQIFNKGKCVAAGASNIYSVLYATHKLRFILRKTGQPVKQGKLFRVNRVCSGDIGHPIDIENFESKDSVGTVKRGESFPGILYFVNSPSSGKMMMFLIFQTGKFIVMGLLGGGDDEAQEAFDLILPVLNRNRSTKAVRGIEIGKAMKKIKTKIADNYAYMSTTDGKEFTENIQKMVNQNLKIDMKAKPSKYDNQFDDSSTRFGFHINF